MTDSTKKDTGPLDWRIAIVDKSGRPTQEFQRRWSIQRGNNSLIQTVETGSGPPIKPDPVQGEVYVDVTADPETLYVANNGQWDIVGVTEFIQLLDVPHSYVSKGSELVQVKSDETGLQFATLSSILDLIGSTQGDILYRGASTWSVLPPGTSGYVLTTGGASANPAWVVTAPSGVTSIALAMPSIFTVAGSPVTGTGTFTVTLNSETANTVFAGPASGGAASPTFRALVSADLPLFGTSQAGAVSASGGGTANFLRADGTWAAPSTSVSGANPTATASDTAVNGTATTYMRSDAAPAVQKATSSLFGIVKVDGTTITATGGVISSVGSGVGGMLPLVNGDIPGPGVMSDGRGQTIGVPL